MKRGVQKSRATQRFFCYISRLCFSGQNKKIVRKRKAKDGLQQVTLKVDKIVNTWTAVTRLARRSYEHEKYSNAVIRI
jgi:hypothetical protein